MAGMIDLDAECCRGFLGGAGAVVEGAHLAGRSCLSERLHNSLN